MTKRSMILLLIISVCGNLFLSGLLFHSHSVRTREEEQMLSSAFTSAANALANRDYEHATGLVYTANTLLQAIMEESDSFATDLNKLSWYMATKRDRVLAVADELTGVLSELGRERSHPNHQNRLRNIINLIELGAQ